jgi:hypothetical protein
MSSIGGSAQASGRQQQASLERLRAYFFSDVRRTIQTVLGLIWVLDGALQFQSFMYGQGFIQILTGMAPAQPHWLASPLLWGAHTMQDHQVLYNTLSALLQLAIGFGILYRRTVKQALVVSFVWTLIVWWFGEAFGMLFMNMANPLTGAPGAVILYAIIGALVWPNERPGGLIGVPAARVLWANLWILMGVLWLLAINSSANATYNLIKTAPAGTAWLATLQNGFMNRHQRPRPDHRRHPRRPLHRHRTSRGAQLEAPRLPRHRDRAEPPLLVRRPRPGRHLHRHRHRSQRGTAVHSPVRRALLARPLSGVGSPARRAYWAGFDRDGGGLEQRPGSGDLAKTAWCGIGPRGQGGLVICPHGRSHEHGHGREPRSGRGRRIAGRLGRA